MKYRIKITTYKNGRKDYKPQVKMLIGWAGIAFDGEHSFFYDYECNSREMALKRIDSHFSGNKKKQTIEFDYFVKSVPIQDLPNCTRVEVIDQDGRSYVNWKPTNKVRLSMQDDGRTAKIFID